MKNKKEVEKLTCPITSRNCLTIHCRAWQAIDESNGWCKHHDDPADNVVEAN